MVKKYGPEPPFIHTTLLNEQNLLFFCFNLLKSIIYLLSKLKLDINKKRDLSGHRKFIKRMVNNDSRF